METTVKQRLIEFLKYAGIGQAKFEKRIGAGNGFVNNIVKSIGGEKLQSIQREFPELSTEWLLYGTGEMLNPRQAITGDHNTQVAGHGNNVNSSEALSKALDEIAEHRKLLAKSQEQIDRLLAIIEKINK
jgi:hypothetical protein